MAQLLRRRDMHGGRKCIIGGLAHIDVIVGVHRLFAADLTSKDFDSAVGNHLIGIHVGLRAGACLPYHQRKMIDQLEIYYLLRRLLYGFSDLLIQVALRHIHRSRSLLDNAQRAHQRRGHLLPANLEILQRTLRLRAPVFIRLNFQQAEGIGFGTVFDHRSTPITTGRV